MADGSRIIILTLALFLCLLFTSCTEGNQVVELGVNKSKLAPCPMSPNCVSSDDVDSDRHIESFRLTGSPVEAWQIIQGIVATLPRTTIITTESNYLHAECRSSLLSFVDDLELHLRPDEGIIAVRSAARLGYSDFGVNQKRVEQLRSELLKEGVIE